MSEQFKMMIPIALMAKIIKDANETGVTRQAACLKRLSRSYRVKYEPPIVGQPKKDKSA